jgi:hypothetical protein
MKDVVSQVMRLETWSSHFSADNEKSCIWNWYVSKDGICHIGNGCF